MITYDSAQSSGYIQPDNDDERVPFDRDSLVNYPDDETPTAGDRVRFNVEGGLVGLWATHVERLTTSTE
ncbi:MAG: hypothetical protein WD423_06405 [Rhodothermales bacterium]